jgi:aerobic carbon-monoxide dehydrogenase large subunit
MPKDHGIGASSKRREDIRFLTGQGRYTDDINLHGQAYVHFLRSDVAHGRLHKVDTSAAEGMPGVIRIFTGKDFEGVGGLPCGWQVTDRHGNPMQEPPHPVLAQGKVRHVGDPIAAVVAETAAEARNAAEAIVLDIEELPAVVDMKKALRPDAPKVHDELTGNLCYDWGFVEENKAAVDEAFAKAAHVTTLELVNNRLAPNPMEPRVAVGDYNTGTDESTLYTTSQNPHVIRLLMGAFVLGIPEHKLRVVAPDVGGGFGTKIFHYAEEAFCTFAAKQIRRPVKWTSSRSEAFITDAHGRDHVTKIELALDAQNNFTAIRTETYANMGAYLSTFAPSVPTWLHGTLMAGNYRTPLIYVNVKAVFTNTVPVDAYRGAGRPEATFQLERLVDKAARELGVDPVALRRQNFITQFPYATPVAVEYDTGDYNATMDKLLEMIDRDGFEARAAKSKADGKLRGLGINCYIEACGIAPSALVGQLGARAGLYESATVRVNATGGIVVMTGSHSHGQGHETVLCAGGGRHDRRARGAGGNRAWRHRQHADGHGHLWLALHRGGRLGHGAGDREDHQQGQEDRGPSDGGLGRRYRAEGRQVHRRGHRQVGGLGRCHAGRLRAAQLSADRAGTGAGRDGLLRSQQLHLSRRRLCLRGGGGPRDRQGHDLLFCRGR